MPKWNLFGRKEEAVAGDEKKTELEQLFERFQTTLDAKLAPVTASVEEMKGKWNKMEEEAATALREEETRRQAAADGDLTEDQKREKRELAQHIYNVETRAKVLEAGLIARIERDYPKLAEEFRAMLLNTPWQVKARPDYEKQCENAMMQLVGRAFVNSGGRYNKNSEKFVLEDGTSGGNEHGDNPLLSGDYDWQDERSGKNLTGSQQLGKLKLSQKDYERMKQEGFIQ